MSDARICSSARRAWRARRRRARGSSSRRSSRIRKLPDYLQIWPGHGAGSACGKALGDMPSSTVGYERMSNWAFGERDVDAFVERVLEGQPEPPAYFGVMKHINREGPPVLGRRGDPPSPPAEITRGAGTRGRARDRCARTRPLRARARAGHAEHSVGRIRSPRSRVRCSRTITISICSPRIARMRSRLRAHSSLIGLDRVAGMFDEEA